MKVNFSFFIGTSKRSLKCVHLHNGNKFVPITIALSTVIKGLYEQFNLTEDTIPGTSLNDLYGL